MSRGRRLLFYSHDTYGLGHLRRSMLIANSLVTQRWVDSIVIVSGSPRAQAFDAVPGVDVVKLPSAIKCDDGSYRSRTLAVDLQRLTAMRASMIRALASSFQPDLILVDHSPVGMNGELGPLIDGYRGRADRPALVIGLRDIVDTAEVVRAEWATSGAWHRIRDDYDRVMVYGDGRVLTTAQELDLETVCPGRVRHVGYLGRGAPSSKRAENPRVLVTPGGGGDGQKLLRAYAAALRHLGRMPGLESHIAMGPFLAPRRRTEIQRLFEGAPSTVRFVGFEQGLEEHVARAWGVVCMGGYNTIMEVLAARRPALCMPRTHPRQEQALRVRRLESRSGIEVCPGSRGAEGAISEFVRRVVAGPVDAPCEVAMNGLELASVELRNVAAAEVQGGSVDAV